MTRPATEEKRRLLEKNELFAELSGEELDHLAGVAKTRRFRAGQVIFNKEDPGSAMMIVHSGQVKVSNFSADGKEVVLNLIDPGQVFGEIAFLDGADRTAAATAIVESELLTLDRRDFIPYLEKQPQVAIKIIAVLCRRLRRTTSQVEDFAFLTLPLKLAKQLLVLAENYGEEIDDGVRISLKLSQREIGGLVGLSRENINRQLKAWDREGLLSLDSGYITILDRATIEDIASYYDS